MGDATLINYTTRDFVSKAELELYINKQDPILQMMLFLYLKEQEC